MGIRTPVACVRNQDPSEVAVGRQSGADTLVQGSFVDSSGACIEDTLSAGVRFVDRTGTWREADARNEGAYALRGLGFGTYWVTASATGYRPLEATVDLRPDRPRLRIDFTLQKSVALRVMVMAPGGRSLSDVMLETRAPIAARLLAAVATLEPPGSMFVAMPGARNETEVGHFQGREQRMADLPSGCIGIMYLDGDPPVHVSLLHHHVVLQTQRLDVGQDEVTFVVAPADLVAGLAAIRVHVVDDATGWAVRGARVMLRGGTHSDAGVATDAMGIAELDRREPGMLDLQVWARGYESFRRPVDARPGTTQDIGTIRLASEMTVQGRVTDNEGHARAASFSVGAVDPGDRSIQWFRGFQSNGVGAFCILGLGLGEYVIRTRNCVDRGGWKGTSWVSGNLRLDTRAGPITGLEIRLLPAAKLVLRMTGTCAERTRFVVVDGHGLGLVDGVLGSEPQSLDLPAGDYRVCLLDSRGSVLSERPVTLGSETILLDLAR
ncbi:MAG TPA: carboxypeptidase regulatory-like domain-containing protein [Planctomycetota bacterium]|nr:carboxypeptidase regulatory-like domain-containing protein [Planctomycetota bacterium]